MSTSTIENLSINTIRTLSMDAVQQANSGHPGTPMAMAPVAYAIYQKFLRYDPDAPLWANRDRFVLSIGHASMLLYSMLYLTGVKQLDSEGKPTGELAVTLDEIKRFRQLHSRTPGHPESHLTSGVETTTGPLGQGVANSVGMAIAERWKASYFNRPGFDLVDYDVYSITGDGCMMEGVASEAASLAGHLKLSNLCWIYDSNRITIEGKTDLAFTEDVGGRFLAYGWNVLQVEDANDLDALEDALKKFKAEKERPTMIIVKSHIAWGAPNKQDTHGAHGEPLGADEIALTKKFYSWAGEENFYVPDGVCDHFAEGFGKRGAELHQSWDAMFAEYQKAYPELAGQFLKMEARDLPDGWDKDLPTFAADAKGLALRDASGKVLNAIAPQVPWVIGGSADLAPSTKTRLTFEGAGDFQAGSYGGRNFHFGVREHAMASIINGMALSKVRAYGSGFLIFSDYARPALRLSALMEIPTIHVFTHDSVGVGEDGPTHQPIEQLASLRAIPNFITIRPGDANEVVEAWRVMMQLTHNPVALVVTRQAVPTLDRTKYAAAAGLAKGAYVLADAEDGKPEVILMATGSEVPLCVEAYEQLKTEGIKARVVSMPSFELFEKQPQEYKESVLPSDVTARVSVELGVAQGWDRYTGLKGANVSMKTFGASAPFKDLLKFFGFTVEKVVEAAKQQLGK
ncbi:MAG: transketolase [Acidobacteriota bacterium]